MQNAVAKPREQAKCQWCGSQYDKNPSREHLYCGPVCRVRAHEDRNRKDAKKFREMQTQQRGAQP